MIGPDADRGCLAPRIADDGGSADDEQTAEIAISHLRYPAHTLLAAGGMLLGHQAEPGGKLATGAKDTGVANGRGDETDPGDCLQTLANCVGAVPSQ